MVTPGQMQMFNKPEPYEAQILGPEYKNQYEWDPSSEIPCAGTYKIRLHDHTLGNALRMQLLRDKRVLFSGYRIPHPLFHELELRIQTETTGSPAQSLLTANRLLIETADSMLDAFEAECTAFGAEPDPLKGKAREVPKRIEGAGANEGRRAALGDVDMRTSL